ncbi:MAG: hypothetical protein ABIB55_02820 [Candidatus Nealsonbacteria bacterium]
MKKIGLTFLALALILGFCPSGPALADETQPVVAVTATLNGDPWEGPVIFDLSRNANFDGMDATGQFQVPREFGYLSPSYTNPEGVNVYIRYREGSNGDESGPEGACLSRITATWRNAKGDFNGPVAGPCLTPVVFNLEFKTPSIGVGSLTLASASLPSTVLSIGEKVVLRFTLSASSEDIDLTSIRFALKKKISDGSTVAVQAEEVKQFKLFNANTQIGSVASLSSTGEVTLDSFSERIPKGTTQTFDLRADVMDKRNMCSLRGEVVSLSGLGVTSSKTITPTGSAIGGWLADTCSIVTPSITVTSPNGGGVLTAGNNLSIIWKQGGLDDKTFTVYLAAYDLSGNRIYAKSGYQVSGSVGKEYLIQDVSAMARTAQGVAADEYGISWVIPSDIASRFESSSIMKYKLGVWSRATGVVDVSDSYFSIVVPAPPDEPSPPTAKELQEQMTALLQQLSSLLAQIIALQQQINQ